MGDEQRAPPPIVHVQLDERSYSIAVGSNLLGATASYQELPRGSSALIVSNETVAPLYGERLAAALAPIYPKVDVVSLPDGEAHKTWQTLQTIFDAMLAAHCDRSTTVFALGGGVVGDLAGFAAACYMRGVAYVQVPTTLLAQVDSSVGGKTGINHPSGKNMIGAFHQPLAVVADVDVLESLPRPRAGRRPRRGHQVRRRRRRRLPRLDRGRACRRFWRATSRRWCRR